MSPSLFFPIWNAIQKWYNARPIIEPVTEFGTFSNFLSLFRNNYTFYIIILTIVIFVLLLIKLIVYINTLCININQLRDDLFELKTLNGNMLDKIQILTSNQEISDSDSEIQEIQNFNQVHTKENNYQDYLDVVFDIDSLWMTYRDGLVKSTSATDKKRLTVTEERRRKWLASLCYVFRLQELVENKEKLKCYFNDFEK